MSPTVGVVIGAVLLSGALILHAVGVLDGRYTRERRIRAIEQQRRRELAAIRRMTGGRR